MSAVCAVNHLRSHGLLQDGVLKLAHSSPLPRVLLSICEENVLALNVKTTVISVGACGEVVRQQLTKDSCAVIRPVRQVQNLRSHTSKFISWRLEEAKFGTVLIGPLTQVRVDINGFVLKRFSVILVIRNSLASTVLCYLKKL